MCIRDRIGTEAMDPETPGPRSKSERAERDGGRLLAMGIAQVAVVRRWVGVWLGVWVLATGPGLVVLGGVGARSLIHISEPTRPY